MTRNASKSPATQSFAEPLAGLVTKILNPVDACVDTSGKLPGAVGCDASVSSSCHDGEGHACQSACSSLSSCRRCEQALHEISNAMTVILMNAQVVGWKLPPYSHLKRSVREIERSAQRGGELLKSLMRQFPEQVPAANVVPETAIAGTQTFSDTVPAAPKRIGAHNRL